MCWHGHSIMDKTKLVESNRRAKSSSCPCLPGKAQSLAPCRIEASHNLHSVVPPNTVTIPSTSLRRPRSLWRDLAVVLIRFPRASLGFRDRDRPVWDITGIELLAEDKRMFEWMNDYRAEALQTEAPSPTSPCTTFRKFGRSISSSAKWREGFRRKWNALGSAS